MALKISSSPVVAVGVLALVDQAHLPLLGEALREGRAVGALGERAMEVLDQSVVGDGVVAP